MARLLRSCLLKVPAVQQTASKQWTQFRAILWASFNIGRQGSSSRLNKIRFFGGHAMKRFAAIGVVGVMGALIVPVAAQKAAGPALEIRALSTRAEFVSGGDVLLKWPRSATVPLKYVTRRVNALDVTPTL